MKKLYSLIVLSMVAGPYQCLAQGSSLAVSGQPLAMPAFSHAETGKDSKAVDIPVTGKVTDEKGDGLPGVSVIVKGSTQGTTTDGTGSFRITVPNATARLVFSFVGYVKKEIVVGEQTSLTVVLTPDDQLLNEVVVVDYGSQLKKEVTGAVQTVSSQEIKDLPVSQLGQKLQGRLAGVPASGLTEPVSRSAQSVESAYWPLSNS